MTLAHSHIPVKILSSNCPAKSLSKLPSKLLTSGKYFMTWCEQSQGPESQPFSCLFWSQMGKPSSWSTVRLITRKNTVKVSVPNVNARRDIKHKYFPPLFGLKWSQWRILFWPQRFSKSLPLWCLGKKTHWPKSKQIFGYVTKKKQFTRNYFHMLHDWEKTNLLFQGTF